MSERSFWLSWYADHGGFELHWPWWVSGYAAQGDELTPIICAAVRAADEAGAKKIVLDSLDEPAEIKWRFVNPREAGWSPYCDRFRKVDWMPDWQEAA